MMRAVPLIVVLTMFGSVVPGFALAGGLRVAIEDGDPLDRIRIVNESDCTVAPGLVRIDMSASEGEIVIDTEEGGLGTRDPFPIQVEAGPISLDPVADGDTSLTIRMGALPPGARAVVTFDGDSQRSFWENRRVVFRPEDLVGTRVRYATRGSAVSTIFSGSGTVLLDLADVPCASEDAPPTEQTTPIS